MLTSNELDSLSTIHPHITKLFIILCSTVNCNSTRAREAERTKWGRAWIYLGKNIVREIFTLCITNGISILLQHFLWLNTPMWVERRDSNSREMRAALQQQVQKQESLRIYISLETKLNEQANNHLTFNLQFPRSFPFFLDSSLSNFLSCFTLKCVWIVVEIVVLPLFFLIFILFDIHTISIWLIKIEVEEKLGHIVMMHLLLLMRSMNCWLCAESTEIRKK